jgi:hypothetical protein
MAIVFALVVLGNSYQGRRDSATSTTVFVAKQVIPVGTLVRPGMFEFLNVPQDEVEAGTLTDIKYIALHYVAHTIYPGQRFRVSNFSP